MVDYEKIEVKNIKRNKKFLDFFRKNMESEGLSSKTIYKHVNNASFYINTFLLHYDIETKMEDGIALIYIFLNDWFIRKCMWASVNSIKETAFSIKKFYKCMMENDYVDKENYEFFVQEIKEGIADAIEALKEFDDIDEFVF